LAEIAAQFSEEDLTRYLQLSLDLFKDLQFSLQPRLHLELGLVRLVQAGRLMPIEQALAQLGSGGPGAGPAQEQPRPAAAVPPPPPAAPRRTGPSPFELDQAKKQQAAAPKPAPAPPTGDSPQGSGDARGKLHAHLSEKGLTHLADAVENATIALSGSDLNVRAPRSYTLYFNDRNFAEAVRQVFGRALNIKVAVGEANAADAAPIASKAAREDEVTTRALNNPEVQRFREVFGGEVRKVRNLKE
jgi:DNA polymerase-3 subunit gamma/tau